MMTVVEAVEEAEDEDEVGEEVAGVAEVVEAVVLVEGQLHVGVVEEVLHQDPGEMMVCQINPIV